MYQGKVITFKRYLAIVYVASYLFSVVANVILRRPIDLVSTLGIAAGFVLFGMIGSGLAMRRYGPPVKQAALATIAPAVGMFFFVVGSAAEDQIIEVFLWGLPLAAAYFSVIVLVSSRLAKPRAEVDRKSKVESQS